MWLLDRVKVSGLGAFRPRSHSATTPPQLTLMPRCRNWTGSAWSVRSSSPGWGTAERFNLSATTTTVIRWAKRYWGHRRFRPHADRIAHHRPVITSAPFARPDAPEGGTQDLAFAHQTSHGTGADQWPSGCIGLNRASGTGPQWPQPLQPHGTVSPGRLSTTNAKIRASW